jgi:hypothetical protein
MLQKLTLNKSNNWVDSNKRIVKSLRIIGGPVCVEETVSEENYKGKRQVLENSLKNSDYIRAGRNIQPNCYLLLQDVIEERGILIGQEGLKDLFKGKRSVRYSFEYLLARKE